MQGLALKYALQPRPLLAFLWAAAVAAALAPLHWCDFAAVDCGTRSDCSLLQVRTLFGGIGCCPPIAAIRLLYGNHNPLHSVAPKRQSQSFTLWRRNDTRLLILTGRC